MLDLLKATTPLMYSIFPIIDDSQAYTASQRQNTETTETLLRKQGLKDFTQTVKLIYWSCKILVEQFYAFLGWLLIINTNLTWILKKKFK